MQQNGRHVLKTSATKRKYNYIEKYSKVLRYNFLIFSVLKFLDLFYRNLALLSIRKVVDLMALSHGLYWFLPIQSEKTAVNR